MAETKPHSLMAYCGLDCSTCFGYTKTISEAAKGLRRTMRAEKMKQVWPSMPFLGDCDAFKKESRCPCRPQVQGMPRRGRQPFLQDTKVLLGAGLS